MRGDPLKNLLSEYRTKAGLRQAELADSLGVSRQTVISIENGKYNPSITLAFKIAKHFGVKIEDIFIFEE